jgi:N-acetylmuramoyl-L-alanine amidase
MKICVSIGHSILKSGENTSVNGIKNEYRHNKSLAPKVVELLKKKDIQLNYYSV